MPSSSSFPSPNPEKSNLKVFPTISIHHHTGWTYSVCYFALHHDGLSGKATLFSHIWMQNILIEMLKNEFKLE